MAVIPSRLKWSIYLGNLFLHYDSALFGLLAPFIAPLFFPHEQKVVSLIFTYAMIPLAMMARPVGSLIFGYIGDHIGRKEALFGALCGMSIITLCMGFLPLYAQAGYLAPLLLLLGRFLQNFFAAGESIGGAIYLVENSATNKKNLTSSLFNASTVAGIIVASSIVSLFCFFGVIENKWRSLYWFGASAFIFAAFLRVNIKTSLLPAISLQKTLQTSLKSCFQHRQKIWAIAVVSGFSYSTYSIALVMMNGFIPLITRQTHEQMVQLNTFLLIADFFLLPAFGFLANYYSRERVMLAAAITGAITSIPLFWMLDGASAPLIASIRFFLMMVGVSFSAPFHAWSQELINPDDRYTVISFAYAIGTQILGGPTVAISLWLFHQTGYAISAASYWTALATLTSYVILKEHFMYKKQLESALQISSMP